MQKKALVIALSVVCCQSMASRADDGSSVFSFKGFGTLGVVHSDEDGADFRGTVFQPNGVGNTRGTDIGPDTKLGAQLTARFSDKWSAVIQGVSQHQFDNSYRPLLEWANIKFQATDELAIRGGRIVLPAFLISDSRFVGYAQPWIRPPQEVYFVSSITNSDGADITWQMPVGAATNTAQAFYGVSDAKLSSGRVQAEPAWGVNDALEINSWTLRAAYIALKIDLEIDSFNPLFDGLDQFGDAATQFGFAQAGSEAHALASRYDTHGLDVSIVTVGAQYDPGSWFAMAEYAKFNGDGFLQDSDSGYITAGIRIDKFTPYLTYAKITTDTYEEHISTAGLPAPLASGADQLSAGINASLNGFFTSQESYSAGVRWDFSRSADLKLQYDRINLQDGTLGRLSNPAPGFDPSGETVNLLSAAVDFVF